MPTGHIVVFSCMPRWGRESEVAHKWAGWLHNPYRLWGPLCFRARDKIRSGPTGYITPAMYGVTYASEQGTQSEVAHKVAT